MRDRWHGAARRAGPFILILWALLHGAGCGVPAFRFLSPLPGQLSRDGDVVTSILLPSIMRAGSLRVTLDGVDVTAAIGGAGSRREGVLPGIPAGTHRLEAFIDVTIPLLGMTFPLGAETSFDTIALTQPDACEILNAVECLLPYPSSRFLVPDPSKATGLRLDVPAAGMPPVHPALATAAFNTLDGFAPTTQILVHFPGGVSVERSDAPRLLVPGCCGQPAGPPWRDTRVADDRSLDVDSPTVIVDADTGERVLHIAELDARATATPARQALVLRPLRSLTPGHRYLVALRHLVRDDGSAVAPEAPFAALRDRRPSDIPQLVARRAAMEDVFARLASFGIARDSLQLAFDFTTQSDHQLTHQMLSMRDQAFAWLETVESDTTQTPFTVRDVTQVSACSEPADVVWQQVAGTFRSPLFLPQPPVQDPSAPALQLSVDAEDVPVQNGFMDAPFTISIPCASLDSARETHPLVLGHGAFGNGDDMVRGIPGAIALLARTNALGDWTYIAGATDWQSLCCGQGGVLFTAFNIIGLIQSRLNDFATMPDRTKQGELNTLVLTRLMKRGLFNRDAAFRVPDGHGGTRGVFPGELDPANEAFYFGISLGGINGLFLASLTPDIERFHVDVPAINFSQLLQRSTLFANPLAAGLSFETLIGALGLRDPLHILVGYDLLNELWVSGEPGGYATHITSNPLPGSGVGVHADGGKKVLMTMAWLDKTVPNLGTETAARTLGLPQLDGSLLAGMPQVPDVAGPRDSAFVVYDHGAFDIFDPADAPYLPPLDNRAAVETACDPHGTRWEIPAGIAQQLAFLRPGGVIENFCRDNGVCDASQPFEIPRGDATPCSP